MKKLIYTGIITLSSILFVSAQTDNTNTSSIGLGVKSGANLSNFYGEQEGLSIKMGYHVAGVLKLGITDIFVFQPELMYSSAGAQSQNTIVLKDPVDAIDAVINTSSTTRLNYFALPLMFKFYPVDGFNIEFGPQLAFLTSASGTITEVRTRNGITTVNKPTVDKNAYKSTDFGVNFGFGYELESGVNFGLRYNLGLSDLNEKGNNANVPSIKNGVLQLSVGYNFNL